MKAAIDIGSNTVLLLVGEVHDGKVRVIYEAQEAPRLGRGVDADKNLHSDSVRRVIDVLKSYKSTLQEHYPNVGEVLVMATSAVRDANNKNHFIKLVKDETDFNVEVLSGEEEAELTFRGAQSVLEDRTNEIAVIDIGGGSTEIALGNGEQMTDRFSFDIGSVRFTERYLKSDPPTDPELHKCRAAVSDALSMHSFELSKDFSLIGVAGTVTSIPAIQKQYTDYNPDKLNGVCISLNEISGLISRFTKMTTEERLEINPVFLKGRADVMIGGLVILEVFMKQYDIEKIISSTGGIRHGGLIVK